MEENTTTFETNESAKDGQTKCPKCGATDISLNVGTGKLRCNFCRHEFEPEVMDDMKSGVGDLHGEQVSSGAADIGADADSTMTLKCTSCGAEVVINLEESTQARCHWCRNMLSVNSKVENGAVPDVVLPFKMKKDEAKGRIEEYVLKRKFFANKTFRSEFTTDNIMGVYFPYMLVDMKGHAVFSGEGEIERGSYTRTTGSGDDKHEETIYKVDSYSVFRECDVEIDDLAVESSSRRASANSNKKETNNIINAILPFDTENCVKYDSNYLHGYTSEKRDVNKSDLQEIVDSQEKEAIKYAVNDSVKDYDRGVRWDDIQVNKQGEKWLAAYLPVWLYSYMENPGKSNEKTHFVAVNARTAETVGSVPINKARIWSATLIGAIIGALLGFAVAYLTAKSPSTATYAMYSVIGALIIGIITYMSIYGRYRNASARHHFEYETKLNVSNMNGTDDFIRHFETSNSSMTGANNHRVDVKKLEAKGSA